MTSAGNRKLLRQLVWLVILAVGIILCVKWQASMPRSSWFARANVLALCALFAGGGVSIIANFARVNPDRIERAMDLVMPPVGVAGIALMWFTSIFLIPQRPVTWILTIVGTVFLWLGLRIRRNLRRRSHSDLP